MKRASGIGCSGARAHFTWCGELFYLVWPVGVGATGMCQEYTSNHSVFTSICAFCAMAVVSRL